MHDASSIEYCRYATLGYIVLACDMFGDGVEGDRDRVTECLTGLRDNPALMLADVTALATRQPPGRGHSGVSGDQRGWR